MESENGKKEEEEVIKVSESTPLRAKFKRTASTIEHLDDTRRSNLIRTLGRSSTNMITISIKKYYPEEVLKEYLRNENFDMEEKNEGFEVYYSEGSAIGEGSSSVVKKCTDKKTGKVFAVKIIRTNEKEKINQAKNEFLNLKFLNSDLIIKAYEWFYNPTKGRIWTVLEYDADLNNLTQLVEKGEIISEGSARTIFKLFIKGILTMHKNGVCHRDLKPDNILANIEGTKLKIIDFNISKKRNIGVYDKHSKNNMSMLTHIGTIDYTAPEILRGYSQYSEQVDMWSAGAILYYILSGQSPFIGENMKEIIERISGGKLIMKDPMWDYISDEAKDLILNLLQVDPLKRLSAYEALHHPWLNKVNPLGDNHSIFNPRSFSTRNYYTYQNQQKQFNFDEAEINYLNIESKISESKTENDKNSNIYQAHQTNSTNYFLVHESNRFRSKSSKSSFRVYKNN